MKFKKWQINFNIHNPFPKDSWMHYRQIHFDLFSIHLSDIIGVIRIFNIQIKWEKMFK